MKQQIPALMGFFRFAQNDKSYKTEMIKTLILVLLISLFLVSCGRRDDKPQEYVDEKPPVEETKKEDESKQDSVTRPENKDEGRDKFDYKRNETPVAVISPLDATEYMGKYVTVKGFVADVYKSEKVAYLNFIKKYPDNPFSAVIFAREFEAFGDLEVYENRNVEISGRISTYRGKPQMILDKPSQIKAVN